MSWMCVFIAFIKFGKFLAIIKYFVPACFFFFCNFMMRMLAHLMTSHRPLRLGLFFFIPFSFCSSAWMNAIALSLHSLIWSSACSNLPLNSFSEFSFYCTFHLQNFCFGPFHNFCLHIRSTQSMYTLSSIIHINQKEKIVKIPINGWMNK